MYKTSFKVVLLIVLVFVFATAILWSIGGNGFNRSTAKATPVDLCSTVGCAQPEDASSVNATLAKLPADVLRDFKDTGWEMVVTADDLAVEFGDALSFASVDSRITGITDPATKRVLVADFAPKSTVYHEIGHWFDLEHGNPSRTVEFTQTVAESNHFLLAIAVDPFPTSNQELFADLFAVYIERPSVLKVTALGVYDYFHGLLTEERF